jgi:hypothetical protein
VVASDESSRRTRTDDGVNWRSLSWPSEGQLGFLLLEGCWAGLSLMSVLRKREPGL